MVAPERSEADPEAGAARARALGRRECLAFAAGLALAGAPRCARWTARPGRAPLAYWVADREAGELAGLDRDLFVVERLAWPSPYGLLPGAEGGLWVLSAARGDPRETLVARLGSSGVLGPAAELAGPVRASSHAGRDALLVLASGAVLRACADGAWLELGHVSGARCAAGAGATVVVGTGAGALVGLSAHGAARPLFARAAPGEVVDLAPGPRAGTWWSLCEGAELEVALLDRSCRPIWRAPAGLPATGLVPVPARESVWLADLREARIRRLAAGGACAAEAGFERQVGLGAGLALEDGGALWALPGAVLRVDAAGVLRRAQGGFAFAAALAVVGRR